MKPVSLQVTLARSSPKMRGVMNLDLCGVKVLLEYLLLWYNYHDNWGDFMQQLKIEQMGDVFGIKNIRLNIDGKTLSQDIIYSKKDESIKFSVNSCVSTCASKFLYCCGLTIIARMSSTGLFSYDMTA